MTAYKDEGSKSSNLEHYAHFAEKSLTEQANTFDKSLLSSGQTGQNNNLIRQKLIKFKENANWV